MADLSTSDIHGAVARAWCHDVNRLKCLDSDLARAASAEVEKLIQPLLAENKELRERLESEMQSNGWVPIPGKPGAWTRPFQEETKESLASKVVAAQRLLGHYWELFFEVIAERDRLTKERDAYKSITEAFEYDATMRANWNAFPSSEKYRQQVKNAVASSNR